MTVQWGELPPPHQHRVNYDAIVTELQTRPGHWGCVSPPLWNSDAYRRAKVLRRMGCWAEVRRIRPGGGKVHELWAAWPPTVKSNPKPAPLRAVGEPR